MSEENNIIKIENHSENENNEDILLNKLLIKEIKMKIKSKIDKNDPAFIKTLKYMLSDDGTRKKSE